MDELYLKVQSCNMYICWYELFAFLFKYNCRGSVEGSAVLGDRPVPSIQSIQQTKRYVE